MDVRRILTAPDRNWHSVPGASADDLARLEKASPLPIPEPLLDLLRQTNGGEGDLALPPLLFVLDTVDDIIDGLNDAFLKEEFPQFLFFGGNSGLERIAFDLRKDTQPLPIVMIDPIAGPESAETIAPDIETFIAAIGVEFDDADNASSDKNGT
ncbi:MAG: SMI1/KNR4 family protein [Pirellulales bacterium]